MKIHSTMTRLTLAFLAVLVAPARAGDRAPRDAGYARAVDAYNAYINRQRGSVWHGKEENLPFLMVQGDKTVRSIVLVHGLTDSPYYMRELGKIFFDKGYNVVGVRLQGHGTKPEDLQDATRAQWQLDVKNGIRFAQDMGDEVSLAGFSTGGAMILDAVAQRQRLPEKDRWHLGDVYLFSPALDMNEENRTKVAVMCHIDAFAAALKELVSWVPTVHDFQPWVSKKKLPEDNDYRYNNMATNGVCQLYLQVFVNKQNRKEIDAGLKSHGVFIVESMADTTVSPTAVPDWQSQLPTGIEWDMSLYPAYNEVRHNAVTRSETNPHFGAMKDRIEDFIDRCGNLHEAREKEKQKTQGGLRDLHLIKK